MKMGAVVLAVLLSGTAIAVSAADNGIITKASRYPVAETMDRFEAAAKKRGFKIVARVNHSGAGGKVWLSYNAPEWLKARHGIEGADKPLAGMGKALAAMAAASVD